MGTCIAQHPQSTRDLEKRDQINLEQHSSQTNTKLIESENYEHQIIKIQSGIRSHLAKNIAKKERDELEQHKPKQGQQLQIFDGFHGSASQQADELLKKLGSYIYDNDENFKNSRYLNPYQFDDGTVYVGQWYLGQKHGRGKLYWSDGTLYEGYFENDLQNIQGRLITADGEYYIGEWQDGCIQGKGIYKYSDGTKYNGQFLNNLPHGNGIETWPDGTKFEGGYEKGLKCGAGRFLWTDGSIYEGNIINDQIDGHGTFTWADQRKYIGQWRRGMMNGIGEFYYPDGSKYIGNFINDLRNGQGIFYWTDGSLFDGQWKNGLQHGVGMKKDNAGKSIEQQWNNGQKIILFQ